MPTSDHQGESERPAQGGGTHRGPLRIVVGGASGLVGSALCTFLQSADHRVQRLVRRPPPVDTDEIPWNPDRGRIDCAALDDADAIVHLGGESIAAGRWNAARKAAIRDSRVRSTSLLSNALAGLRRKPRVFVCASAIGYYGDRGDDVLNEESPAGEGFLPDVCVRWEAATEPAWSAGVRVVNLRIGTVLSAAGGALAKMLTPFRLGLGGVLGHGRQYMSWIALEDLVRAIEHVMFADALCGPVNAVAPNPVTNRQFTKTLGRVLRRPTLFRMPAPAVRLLLGEMGRALLLEGCRVLPVGLQRSGFEFRFAQLEAALRREHGRARD